MKSCENCRYAKKGSTLWYCKMYRQYKDALPCVDWRKKDEEKKGK